MTDTENRDLVQPTALTEFDKMREGHRAYQTAKLLSKVNDLVDFIEESINERNRWIEARKLQIANLIELKAKLAADYNDSKLSEEALTVIREEAHRLINETTRKSISNGRVEYNDEFLSSKISEIVNNPKSKK